MGATTAIWIAGAIAFGAAAIELLARYRDDPLRAVLSWPAGIYTLVNGATGIGAALWLRSFFPDAVSSGTPPIVDNLKLAMVAGFGSLVVLRTSLIKLRIASGQDVSVGPAVIVEQLLSVIDRGVDRHLASRRAEVAKALAGRLDFDRDNASLVSLCLVLLQNPSSAEEQEMTAVSRALAGRTDLAPRIKTMSLLLALLGVVGEKVLRQAVESLETPAERPEVARNIFAQPPPDS